VGVEAAQGLQAGASGWQNSGTSSYLPLATRCPPTTAHSKTGSPATTSTPRVTSGRLRPACSNVPILDDELAHLAKLDFVLGDESEPKGTSVCRNQQVIGTDGCSSTPQVIADVCIVFIYGLLHREYGKCAQDSLDSINESRRTAARSAEPQFARNDNTGADSVVPDLSETLGSGASRLLHEPRKDVGVEQVG